MSGPCLSSFWALRSGVRASEWPASVKLGRRAGGRRTRDARRDLRRDASNVLVVLPPNPLPSRPIYPTHPLHVCPF